MKTSRKVCCRSYIVFAAIIFLSSVISARAADSVIALKAARMFDGKSKSLITNVVVVIQGDKIVDVGSNVAIPTNAKVIEFAGIKAD